jgi:ABC-type amino acid transport substrate-binding protein
MKAAHYITVVFLALIMGYVGAKFGQSGSATQAEVKKETAYERVLRTGVLRCGYAMWPPLVLNKDPNTGELTGIMKDTIEEAAKNLNLKVEWVEETGWGTYPEGLKSGRFDAFCAGNWRSAAKGREIRYTVPVFYSPVYAYVRADDTRFDNGFKILNDPQYKISGQDGEYSELVARKHFPKATYVGQPQMSELGLIFVNVADGKADIVFNAPDVADGYTKNNPGKLKQVSSEPYAVGSTSYTVAMKEVDLQHLLDTALIELIESGMMDKILEKNKAPTDQFLRVAQPYQTVNEE